MEAQAFASRWAPGQFVRTKIEVSLSKKRKIAIFTGNRAEYGLQMPIIRAVAAHPDLEYYLLVSGAHLQEDFGKTLSEIEKDGFRVHAEVKLDMEGDHLLATARAIGTGIINLSTVLHELKPDLFVVYADRFEGFSAMITGTQMGIPTAHIEGGDITEGGALDDSVRHAMTKLAHLHFTTNEDAASRVKKLGEEPWRVFNVGFPSIDLILDGNYAKVEELEKKYGITRSKPVIVFTQHSVTTEVDQAVKQIQPSLEAMRLLAEKGYQIILTYPNNDAGGRAIIRELESFAAKKIPGVQVFPSLGRHNYHGFLNLMGTGGGSGACVGNSSSGIKETPVFGCPNVNVGSRQAGRLRAENVIDAGYDRDAILAACRKATEDQGFRKLSAHCTNPYGQGGTGKKVADILARIELDQRLLQKKMTY